MKFLYLLSFCISIMTFVHTEAKKCTVNSQCSKRNIEEFNLCKQEMANISTIVSRSVSRIALTLDSILSYRADANANIVFAPINIIKTIGCVMLGAGGSTEREIMDILQVASCHKLNNTLAVHQHIGQLLTDIAPKTKGAGVEDLKIAGAVFVQNGFNIKEKFKEDAKSIYKTDITYLNFRENGDEAARQINEWVSSHTEGKIRQLIDPPADASTNVIFAGVLYFSADWEYPFQPKATKWQPFYLGKEGKRAKESVQVEMMVNQAKLPYYESTELNFESVGLPYKGSTVYMYIVLPRINTSLKELTACMTHRDLEQIVRDGKEGDVYVVMPKMKLSFKTNLRSSLERLRVRSMFSQSKANFSQMTDTKGAIYATDVLHQVEMDINELGTTAAAATAVNVNRGGFLSVRVDRPFFFFIYNRNYDVITFWGSIQKPTPFK